MISVAVAPAIHPTRPMAPADRSWPAPRRWRPDQPRWRPDLGGRERRPARPGDPRDCGLAGLLGGRDRVRGDAAGFTGPATAPSRGARSSSIGTTLSSNASPSRRTFQRTGVVLAGTEDHGLLGFEDTAGPGSKTAELADRDGFDGLSFLADGRVVAGTDAGVGPVGRWRPVLAGRRRGAWAVSGAPCSWGTRRRSRCWPACPKAVRRGGPASAHGHRPLRGRRGGAGQRRTGGLIANVFVGLSFSPGLRGRPDALRNGSG